MIPAKIGLISLVGIGGSPPHDFGNYFNFQSGERCLNMWGENLEFYTQKNAIKEVECLVFEEDGFKLAFVIDERIPQDWLHDRLCVTGCGWHSRALCEACCCYVGASTEFRICGCEEPTQSPGISTRGCMGKIWPWTYHCHHCGREWKDRPEPTEEQIVEFEKETEIAHQKMKEWCQKNPIIVKPGFALLDNRKIFIKEF
jgi:hypothetical protein